jgi:DNA-binding PadR family transcriptional regulator
MRQSTLSPLSLAVLELLHERPMHPYEIQHRVVERGLDSVIKLRPASLYSTVDRLAKAGLIGQVETSREGRRPERTVYRLTDAGEEQLMEGLRTLLSQPVTEYPVFAAALAFIAVFPPEEATRLLEWRVVRLEAEVAAAEVMLAGVKRSGIARLFVIEGEYGQEMRIAELNKVRRIVEEMKSGDLSWPSEVLAAHKKPGWVPERPPRETTVDGSEFVEMTSVLRGTAVAKKEYQ